MKEVDIKSVIGKFGRLAHDNKHNIAYTHTIKFIARQGVPSGKNVNIRVTFV